MKTARATSFATPKDLRAYIKCRDTGGTSNHCLSVGDNGEGCFGDETWDVHGAAMCALPTVEMVSKWGTKAAARGKKVRVNLAGGGSVNAPPFICECRDQSPDGVIDLNPAALVAAGLPFDAEINMPCEWEWVDVPAPVPVPPAPTPTPKVTQHYAIYSESPAISFADVQRIAAACHAQASQELYQTWGKRVAVEAVESASEVPLGHFRVIIKDEIGDGALGYHTDEHGQPVCYIKAESVEDTCVTCSHEILEASVDSFGNRFIVCDIPPYGKVRVLVEIADPPESFAYADHGLPVSDFILPEFFDETVTPGIRYSYKGHIKEPQTIAEGGYFSFMLPNGQWMQRTWFSGDQPIWEGPFDWRAEGRESMRELIDRQTLARRPV